MPNSYEVEMVAFRDRGIRVVDVPDADFGKNAKSVNDILELIFKWGQNEFQAKEYPSVSVGDVIRLGGKRYMVMAEGFKEVKEGDPVGWQVGYGFGKAK